MTYCLFILNFFCDELQIFFTLISFIPLQTIVFPIWIPIQSCLYSSRICLNLYLDSTPLVDNSIHIVSLPPYPPSYTTPYMLPYLHSYLAHLQTTSNFPILFYFVNQGNTKPVPDKSNKNH